MVRLWDLGSGSEIRRFGPFDGPIWCVAFSPNGPDNRHVLSGGWRTTLKLWDLATGELLQDLGKQGMSVDFAPDGRTAITAAYDGVRIWDVVDRRQLKQLLNV